MRVLPGRLYPNQAKKLILDLLKENPRKQYTTKEIASIINLCKSTTLGNIRRLRKSNQVIVKEFGRYNLIRINDPSQLPIPHELEKPQLLQIKPKNQSKRKIVDKEIYVPKKIRKYLNWEEGEQILFFEKDKEIILKIK